MRTGTTKGDEYDGLRSTTSVTKMSHDEYEEWAKQVECE